VPPISKLMACSILVSALASGFGCSTYRAALLYQRGTDELNRGEIALAVVDLERAAELAPRASEIQNHLGLALSAAGRDDDAHRAFERAAELDCSNTAAAHNLALVEAGGRDGETVLDESTNSSESGAEHGDDTRTKGRAEE
jgi:lipoprotein NlpI